MAGIQRCCARVNEVLDLEKTSRESESPAIFPDGGCVFSWTARVYTIAIDFKTLCYGRLGCIRAKVDLYQQVGYVCQARQQEPEEAHAGSAEQVVNCGRIQRHQAQQQAEFVMTDGTLDCRQRGSCRQCTLDLRPQELVRERELNGSRQQTTDQDRRDAPAKPEQCARGDA